MARASGPARQALEILSGVVAAIELTPMVAVRSFDRNGIVCFWNRKCAELYGTAPEAALGQPLSSLVSYTREADYLAAIGQVWLSGQPWPPGDWQVRSAGGALKWIHTTMFPVFNGGKVQQIFCMDVDITGRKLGERSLYLAAQVFENARDAIIVTDQQRRVIAINHACTEITGFGASDMIGAPFVLQHGGGDDPAWLQRIFGELAQSGYWQGEIEAQRQSGERYPAWLSLTVMRDSHGAISNYMAILSDISERKKLEAHTRHLAEHDFLTDLPNRVLLLDRLRQALAAARRKNSLLAILFLDLDHFKHINDTMGHQAGDLLLKEVARRLTKCVRGVDTVSRLGGDEFVIILADIGSIDQAAYVAASILQAITGAYQSEDFTLHVSTSIGISVFPNDGADIDALIKNADIAMYHAKENGRNSFQFFNAEMNAQIVERVAFENGLRHALEQDELVLQYQPEIDISSGAAVGAEALIRWRHPEFGLLAPERFIKVAEECGLMIPIGNWVLNQVCRQARRWLDAGQPLVVAVNLSASQFMQENLLQSVREALAASGLPARLLELEITEAVIMKGGARVSGVLAALRELGLRLTIDDFGTGYSRLGCLGDYPIDKLKIDRSFMADITGNPDDAATISAIIAMARSLKLKVSAEGVETAAQLAFLRSQGCDLYQGFYAGAAMPAAGPGPLLDPVAGGVARAIEADAG